MEQAKFGVRGCSVEGREREDERERSREKSLEKVLLTPWD
jgi:hypothetical protein